ncbi:MAG TPA: hypothetical protein VK449_01380, partial [Anaerolineales bacterium]|nr:hypothetical protein [Anaerolineales bacterium]
MSDRETRLTRAHLVFAGIVLLALGMRVSNLGARPLDDREASQALWAADGSPAASAFWPHGNTAAASAGYQAMTWLAFQLTGGGNATARLWPALLGTLLVLPPWLLRRRFGTVGALAAAFLLAISPTLVAASRTAGGTSAALVAVAFGVAALLLVLDGDWGLKTASSVFAAAVALGLTAGPDFYLGLLGLVPAAGLMLATTPAPWAPQAWNEIRSRLPAAIGVGVLGAIALAVLVGFLPRGLTSLAEGLRLWVAGWIGPGDLHALTPLVILVVYEPLVLVFGIVGIAAAIRGRDSVFIGGAWWALLALVVAVLYPGRTGASAAWCTIPLACLAGVGLAREA